MTSTTAASAPAGRLNQSAPRRYTAHPQADSARKPRATATRSAARGPKRRAHHAERLHERVGRGGERDPVLGGFPARRLLAPHERVQRVVVGEPHPARHPQRHGPGDDRQGRAEAAQRRG